MATAAPPAPPAAPPLRGVQPLRAGQGHSFFWRKLHSLTGIVPIGAFLIEHIVSNYETVNGPLAYAKQVLFLNSLPLVRVLEWTFIFIPLAYHALYGLFIAFRGRASINVYPWAGNWMYLSQRVTGIIAFLYICYHVWTQRFSGVSLPEHPGAAFAKVQHELANPLILAVYVIAMIATTWHFAYGIWLFAAKWGITPGDKARKKFGWVCGLGGAALCLMGLISIYAVVTAPPAPEDVMSGQDASVALQSEPTHHNATTTSKPTPAADALCRKDNSCE
jgi:succinate dehydrogenase / fumarate reductase cytochrome b subunit